MDNQKTKIIVDSQAVIRCLDGTFLISDLLEALVADQKSFADQLKALYLKLKAEGANVYSFRDELKAFIEDNPIAENEEATIIKIFENDVDCNLLQPDSKGWQKGKLKICFQFTPEESESISTDGKSTESSHSPLDEIRQLANNLAVDQN
jgi:KGK domain